MEPDADDVGHGLVERLAEQDGLRLDAADAVAEDTQAVDHRRVGVGPDDRVRVGDPAAVRIRPIRDDRCQELEVDLVDDPGPGRHDAQVAECGLGPAQQLVALAVAVVLAFHVEGEGAGRPELVDLDGVVDDEVGRDQRVDQARVAAEVGHRVAHDGQVDDRRHAGEVLEQDPGRHERDLRLGGGARSPGEERLDILGADDRPTRMAEQVLQQDLDRHRERRQIDPIADGVEPVVAVVDLADAQARACVEGVGDG